VSGLFSGFAVVSVLYLARPVEARTHLDSNAIPARFLSVIAVADSDHLGFLQAATAVQKQPAQPDAPLPDGKGKELAQKYCATCHATSVWTKQHHTEAQWSSIMDNMISKGLNASDDDVDTITAYLAAHFGPVKSAPPTAPSDAAPAPAPAPAPQ
jgi:hypothetical protein